MEFVTQLGYMPVKQESFEKYLPDAIKQLQEAVDYIDWKQGFYDDVLSGKTAYYSNLIPETTPDASESTAS